MLSREVRPTLSRTNEKNLGPNRASRRNLLDPAPPARSSGHVAMGHSRVELPRDAPLFDPFGTIFTIDVANVLSRTAGKRMLVCAVCLILGRRSHGHRNSAVEPRTHFAALPASSFQPSEGEVSSPILRRLSPPLPCRYRLATDLL